MAVAGRSPKHPRTESDDNGLDVGVLMEKAAEKAVEKATDRFSACIDGKIESIWERMDKRIEYKVDSKLGPVMDRLSALEKTGTSSTKSGPSSSSDGSAGCTTGPMLFAPSYLEIKGWCAFRDRNTLGLTEGQAREFVTKLRQGIGSNSDSMIARVGAMRVRNTKIIYVTRRTQAFQIANRLERQCVLTLKGRTSSWRCNSLCG